MNDDLVGRVARAILDWRDMPDDVARNVARAAIAAMREPSKTMIDATYGASVDQVWKRMIDAALKDAANVR